VFGWEDDPHRRNFAIGQPLDMEVPICVETDLSNAATGCLENPGRKSFLTRLLLSGIIRKQAAT